MKTFDQWMQEYEVSHQNPTNESIHMICVPLILFSVIGILWSVPRLPFFGENSFINWATLSSATWLLFYLTLSFKMFFAMSVQIVIMFAISDKLSRTGLLLPVCITVFVLAWIGQFYGHKIEGKRPSFLKDILFLLIGPLWVTRNIFKKIGINV